MRSASPRWGRAMSLRLRMVLISAATVTAMVAVGGLLIILAVRAEFLEAADEVAGARADDVVALAKRGRLPALLPVRDDLEAAVQVVTRGRVVSGTPSVAGMPAFALPAQAPGARQVIAVGELPAAGSGPYRVTAVGAQTSQGRLTVFAAVSTEDVEDVVASATGTGGLGLVLLTLPLSGTLWWVIGRTLAPVAAIRERADAITGGDLRPEVPEPVQLDEIGRLARTINAMLARLRVSADRQRQFLADAAHELRSPVASLRAQLETLQPGDGADLPLLVPDLLAETVRMQNLVDQLLILARSDAGVRGQQHVAVDLDDTIDEVVAASALEGRAPDVPVHQSEVDPVQVFGDPTQLERVVRNLIENAVRHARAQVRVSLAAVDGEAHLVVDDDGPGVPPEHREAVFLRFGRLDDSRGRADGGVGLGLAIVADLVNAHGGTVEVDDAPIGGARFRVRLPLDSAAGPSGSADPAAAGASPGGSRAGSRRPRGR